MKITLNFEGMHMCLIIFQKNNHPNYKLIVAANRDEFYERPTASADFWQDHPEVLAGRDLSKGGTWLGLTKSGQFAAVTNIRKPGMDGADKKSRGALVSNYLTGDIPAEQYLQSLEAEKDDYSGFNLLVGDQNNLFYLNNDGISPESVPDDTHGLSNHHLNTPWPKVVKGRSRLEDYLQSAESIDVGRPLRHPGRFRRGGGQPARYRPARITRKETLLTIHQHSGVWHPVIHCRSRRP